MLQGVWIALEVPDGLGRKERKAFLKEETKRQKAAEAEAARRKKATAREAASHELQRKKTIGLFDEADDDKSGDLDRNELAKLLSKKLMGEQRVARSDKEGLAKVVEALTGEPDSWIVTKSQFVAWYEKLYPAPELPEEEEDEEVVADTRCFGCFGKLSKMQQYAVQIAREKGLVDEKKAAAAAEPEKDGLMGEPDPRVAGLGAGGHPHSIQLRWCGTIHFRVADDAIYARLRSERKEVARVQAVDLAAAAVQDERVLKREEARVLHRSFELVDTDGSGLIDREELERAVVKMCKHAVHGTNLKAVHFTDGQLDQAMDEMIVIEAGLTADEQEVATNQPSRCLWSPCPKLLTVARSWTGAAAAQGSRAYVGAGPCGGGPGSRAARQR